MGFFLFSLSLCPCSFVLVIIQLDTNSRAKPIFYAIMTTLYGVRFEFVWELDRDKMTFSEVLDYGNVESVAWLPQT